ncbi:MAG: hypothetical protein FJ291_11495 [Planctomycetes bacterium]|nr:hypothetical protein [Planctomycetota bacterium]
MLRTALFQPATAFLCFPIFLSLSCSRQDINGDFAFFPDGGGYDKSWKGTGSPEEVVFKGKTILARGAKGTYCCGFTFAVAMRVAASRGLLADKSVEQVHRLQREWFGATPESREKQCVVAAENLGIGRELPLDEARPGDFIQFWRAGGTGHSVVLLRPIRREGKLVGLEYRSSQASTNGIGNRIEHFADADPDGTILRARTYVCRLNGG